MLNLSQIFTIDRPFLKCDFFRYARPSLILVNGENIKNLIDIPREDREESAISLEASYLEFIVM